MTWSWPSDRRGRVIAVACIAAGALFLAKALYRGLTFSVGDFYYTFPGGYAERLNPTLWHSPDVLGALAYNHGSYFYGPTQYLALYPIVFLDSYASVATLLLGVYAFVLVAAWYVLTALLTAGEPRRAVVPAVMFGVVFAFLPLTQALIQREFEVVAWLLLVAACFFWATGREGAAGAAVACLTWFKYWPIALVSAFVLHRRPRALVGFALASAMLLGAAHMAFGLQNFRIDATASIVGRLLRPLGGGEVLYPVIPRGALKSDFCRQWIGGRGTQADVRWALCGVEDRLPFLSARVLFFTLVLATGAAFLWAVYRFERRTPSASSRKWVSVWEFSLLVIAGVSFVHAHYYYLIVFLLPLTALLYWYLTRPQPWRPLKLVLWSASYLSLTAFLVPTSWVSRLIGRDAWALYLESGICLFGTVLLLALVGHELLMAASRLDEPVHPMTLLAPETAA